MFKYAAVALVAMLAGETQAVQVTSETKLQMRA